MADDEKSAGDVGGTETPTSPTPFWNALYVLRNRVIAGFVVALPVIITFIIIKWLYEFLAKDVIGYTARTLVRIWNNTDPLPETGNEPFDKLIEASRGVWFVENVLAPVTAIFLIVGVLFMLGMIFRSRWHRFFNWMMSSVPGVGVIYKSVSNVVDSIRQSGTDTQDFQRVVLVKFPHPGIKVPAFVTSSTIDSNTGKEILCIYVPTTPLPTSGYMLMVPAEEVTEISWDLQETLQAIVSGGITVPKSVEYSIGLIDKDINRKVNPQSPAAIELNQEVAQNLEPQDSDSSTNASSQTGANRSEIQNSKNHNEGGAPKSEG